MGLSVHQLTENCVPKKKVLFRIVFQTFGIYPILLLVPPVPVLLHSV